MKRAVITGMGIISCIGHNTEEALQSLKEGKSGISHNDEYEENGMRAQCSGSIDIDFKDHIDRKQLRFMGKSAAYGYIAMKEAIANSGLNKEQISNPRTGIIMGSGGVSGSSFTDSIDIMRARGVKRAGPYRVPQIMASTVSACLATPFEIKGLNYSISSACASGAHCVGAAVEQIQLGKQDILFAGAGEEEHWSLAALFDAMGALSTKRNDDPTKASRPYDADRDGFVPSCGGGCVVVEELEHALARGANIICEIVGYGATSDGYDMVAPSGEGAARCMRQAMATVDGDIDYLNTHGTSTPVGDVQELKAVREVFGDKPPYISSTKSLTGHGLGAAGIQEAIYSILMLKNDFIAASANIDNLDEEAVGMNIVTERIDNANLKTVMSNSFGFGGTNATLVMQEYKG